MKLFPPCWVAFLHDLISSSAKHLYKHVMFSICRLEDFVEVYVAYLKTAITPFMSIQLNIARPEHISYLVFILLA